MSILYGNHVLDLYRDKYREQNLSYANEIKDQIVSLPLHTMMPDEEIEYLFRSVNDYFGLRSK